MEETTFSKDEHECEIKTDNQKQCLDNRDINIPERENETTVTKFKTSEEKNIVTTRNAHDIPKYINQPITITVDKEELNQPVTIKVEPEEVHKPDTIKKEHVDLNQAAIIKEELVELNQAVAAVCWIREQSLDDRELNNPERENATNEIKCEPLEEIHFLTTTIEDDSSNSKFSNGQIKYYDSASNYEERNEDTDKGNLEVKALHCPICFVSFSINESHKLMNHMKNHNKTETVNKVSSSLILGKHTLKANVKNSKKDPLRYDIVECKGCQKEFAKIKIHLAKTSSCNSYYPTQEQESDETNVLELRPPRNLDYIEASEQVFILENTCRFCKKRFKNVISHLNQSSKCMIDYSNEEIKKHKNILKKSRQSKFHKNHREERLDKMSKYYKDNKEHLSKYHEDNREDRLIKMAQYYKDNKEHLTKYYEDNREKRRSQMAKYHKDNREERLKKMSKYNKNNKKQLAKYHENNREERLIKMAKYYKDKKEHLEKNQEDKREEMDNEMSEYDLDNNEHVDKFGIEMSHRDHL